MTPLTLKEPSMDPKNVNINNVGSLTPQQRASLNRKAVLSVSAFIMLKAFIMIFLNKTSRSLQKRYPE